MPHPNSRYSVAKRMIVAGNIKTLSELLTYVRKTHLARDVYTTPERFNRLLHNPKKFRMDDIYNIAHEIGVDYKLIVALIHEEYLSKGEDTRRRKKKK